VLAIFAIIVIAGIYSFMFGSAGLSMTLKQQACGSVASKPTIAFDLRREPGAGKLHAGICGGGVE
jgi:hypothetical protein